MSKPFTGKTDLDTDVLIIGGGTAGCYAALTISRNSDASVLVAEKANIKTKRLSGSRCQCTSMLISSKDANLRIM